MNGPVSRSTWIQLAVDLAAVLLLTFLLSLAVRGPRPEGEAVVPETAKAVPTRSLPGKIAPTPVPRDSHGEELETEAPEGGLDLERFRGKGVKVELHEIRIGENYWSIAKDYGISVKTILGANPDMAFTAAAKQVLRIPSKDGVLHHYAKGETLKTIAETYKVDEKTVTDANRFGFFSPLREGDLLWIPGADPVKMSDRWRSYYESRGMFGIPFSSWGKGWTSAYGLRKDPITGEARMHKGMDFKAKSGVEVFASAGGRVNFAGVSGGYGNLIILSHGKGYTSYYGHLSRIEVKTGQKVRRGQRIGRVGTTGRVTGPHLHFEIRKNGRNLDPLLLI